MKIKKYDYDFSVCPKCGKDNWVADELEINAENKTVQQTIICFECGATWRDVYKFAFAETDE